jgi:hypothetical protein
MNKVLICSAWEPEQAGLRDRIADHISQGRLSDARLELDFMLCGVGVFAALESVMTYLAAKNVQSLPQLICFVGTAGANQSCFSEKVELPFADCVREVVWYDAAVASGKSYIPGVMQQGAALTGGRFGDFHSNTSEFASEHLCVSCYGISTRPNDFGNYNGRYENLELYGVARAAARFGISWRAFLGISNWIGASAHQEWREYHEPASACAQRLCYAALFGGGSSSN